MLAVKFAQSSSVAEEQKELMLARSIWRHTRWLRSSAEVAVFSQAAWHAYVQSVVAKEEDGLLPASSSVWSELVRASLAKELSDYVMRPSSPTGAAVQQQQQQGPRQLLALAHALWQDMYGYLAPEDAPVFTVKAWYTFVAKACGDDEEKSDKQVKTWTDLAAVAGDDLLSNVFGAKEQKAPMVFTSTVMPTLSERMQQLESMEKELTRVKKRLDEVVTERQAMVPKFRKCCSSFARIKPGSAVDSEDEDEWNSMPMDKLDKLAEAQVRLGTRTRTLSHRSMKVSSNITLMRTLLVDELKGTWDEIAQERDWAWSRWQKVKAEAMAQLEALGYSGVVNEVDPLVPEADNRNNTLANLYELKEAKRRIRALTGEQVTTTDEDVAEGGEDHDDNEAEKRWQRTMYGFPCNRWAQCTGEQGMGLTLTVAPNRHRCGVVVKKQRLHVREYAAALEAYDEHYGINEDEQKKEDPSFMHKAVTDNMTECIPVYVLMLSQVQLDSEEIMQGRSAPPSVWVFGEWFGGQTDGARFALYDPIQRVPLTRLAFLPAADAAAPDDAQ